MALSDELSEMLAQTVTEKQETEAGTWVPYVGPAGGEGWQNVENPEDVRYQEEPPGEVAEGYNEEYWGDDEEEGYYNENDWGRAFLGTGTGWTSPDDVPEGTVIEFETNAGTTAEGVVEGMWWGNETWDEPASLQVNLVDDDAEFSVTPNEILDVLDVPGDEGGGGSQFQWDTDVPRVDEIQENSDVLYVDETGVRRVGEFEEPTFVEGVDGTYPGAELADGTEVRLDQIVAIDEGPVSLEPREDPHEFSSERDPIDVPPDEVTWDESLEHTPFSSLGEVPLGVTARVNGTNHPDAPGVHGVLDGEVVGYWDGDAEYNEPNGLEIDVPNHGKMIVFPGDLMGFVDSEGEFDTAQYLSTPFEDASRVTGSRQAGIGDGNTTGADMKILTMPDDRRVFATPVDAYNDITTGVVDSAAEARRNNLNSPVVIEHLGGNACATDIVESPDGEEHIAKEGIEGSLFKKVRYDLSLDDDRELVESLEETLAAAYFVGNSDLHGANLMVNREENEATVIDHDSAGPSYGSWMDMRRISMSPARHDEIENHIYENCREYMRGDMDIPEEIEGTAHESYFMQAVESVVNNKDHQEVFEPWETSSHETVDGFDSLDSFEEGMEVTVLDSDGRVRTATLTDRYRGSWYGETDDNYEVGFSTPHNVLEVHGAEPANAPEYHMENFGEGDRLTVSSGGLSDEEVVVEEYDDEYDRLRVHPVDDPDDVFHVNQDNEVVDVMETRDSPDGEGEESGGEASESDEVSDMDIEEGDEITVEREWGATGKVEVHNVGQDGGEAKYLVSPVDGGRSFVIGPDQIVSTGDDE